MSRTAEAELHDPEGDRRQDATSDAKRPRGGRPTKAAAAERDERLLDIATRMFMEQGFEATSIDALAEAAAIGKATLYARYADKTALFADVLHRRILAVYGPLQQDFDNAPPDSDLATLLHELADRLVTQSLSEEAVTLSRILSAQGPRFPTLARLAIQEGYGRQLRLIEGILARFEDDPRYALPDVPLAAELFQALVLGPSARFKIFGLAIDPGHIRKRTEAAVRFYVRGLRA